MADTYLTNGVRNIVASEPQRDHDTEEIVAVMVNGGRIPWVLRFWARLGASRVYIGGVRIFASRTNRLVAVLSAPGARSFEVEGKGADTTPDNLEISFEGVPGRGGPWGVTPIPGNSVLGARSYRVLTGVGSPAIVNCTGEVHGWTAYTTQAGATIVITAQPNLVLGPIIVPQNGSISGDAMGLLAPVSVWTFGNVDAYLIEYVPPGLEYDG
jgi:hypothetical protein